MPNSGLVGQMTFTHPFLCRPLDTKDQVELITAMALHRADQPLSHAYDGRQSSGGDMRLTDNGSLGSKFVGSDW